MSWQQLEKIFNRSLQFSFSKEKWLLVFPVLALCGFLAVICRTISYGASQWIQMSVAFLPIFLCAGLLLAVGIILTKVYHHEIQGLKIPYLQTIKRASDLFIGIAYLAVPLIFTYLILWMILGLFYLLRATPAVGEFMSSIFSFGPFLLVLGSLALSFLNLLILFYITPAAAMKSDLGPKLFEEVLLKLKDNPFLAIITPLIALFPLLIVVGILSLAAVVTQIMYAGPGHGLSIALKWFFTMLPFCALLTPAVTFFFNFATESYALMHKQLTTE